MAKNYYAILGLTWNATAEEIREAYRRLAKEFHPDHYGGDRRMFLDIQEAYSTLSVPSRRRAYDEHITRRPARSYRDVEPYSADIQPEPLIPEDQPADIGDISLTRSFQTFTPSFDEIFDRLWSNFSNLSRRKSEGVQNLTLDVPITPEQARRGGQARILVPAQARCPSCRGYGGVGPYECAHCAGEGVIVGDFPVSISFPPGLQGDHTVLVSLDRFGIRNLYLAVSFRLTSAEEI
ncbi:MAG: J domain-containing protein [Sedimentisphaerales bacterium]|nr:J domain-containing protein [Sedimentisphaerales bacterium]